MYKELYRGFLIEEGSDRVFGFSHPEYDGADDAGFNRSLAGWDWDLAGVKEQIDDLWSENFDLMCALIGSEYEHKENL